MTGEQLTLDGSAALPLELVQRQDKVRTNPLLPIYGPGPEGTICKTCRHLYLQGGTAGRYLKCELRKNTRGPGTDHRAGWPSCGRYEEEP